MAALVLRASVPGIAEGASVSGHSERKTDVFPLTGFGGYQWLGPVTQISAQWLVPSFVSQSVLGEASTWVGAQTSGNKFIQLGIVVDCPARATTVYEAFWSDTKMSFLPQILGRVFPGDKIFASMMRNSHGWSLSFDDPSSSISVVKEIRYGVGATFTEGEWLQEDPAPADISAQDVPYPDITNVKFQKLKVDHHVPHLTLKDGQTLSANGGVLRVPTPVHHDSFTFKRPKGVADQYLKDAREVDYAENKFNAELATWKRYSDKTKSRYVEKLLEAFRSGAADFKSQYWPKATHRDVSKLVKGLGHDATGLKAWAASDYKNAGTGLTRFEDGYVEDDLLTIKLRALLKLPPP